MRAADLELEGHDLVCLAVPAKALPAAVAAHGGRITAPRRGARGLQGRRPAAGHAALGVRRRALQRARGRRARRPGRTPPRCWSTAARWWSRRSIAASPASSRDILSAAGLDVQVTNDVTGVELAGAPRTSPCSPRPPPPPQAGPNVAGAAAGKVFAEIDALARARGGRPETFAGVAGAGDARRQRRRDSGSRNRRAGELLAQGVPAAEIGHALGQGDRGRRLRAAAGQRGARRAQLDAPALDGLAALVEGRIEPEQWAATVTEPPSPERSRSARAA